MTYDELADKIRSAKAHLDQVRDIMNVVECYISSDLGETVDSEIDCLDSSLDDALEAFEKECEVE